MQRLVRNIAIAVVALLATTSCFKKVTTDTTLRIKVLSEEASGGERTLAEGCYAYIYYTEKEDWTVATYEEAAAKAISNPATGEVLTEPDGESEIYVMEGSTNRYLSIFQDSAPALLVVVYPEKQMYAYMYRKAEAENLHYTYLTLIFHTWKTDTYNEGSKDGYRWTIVVPKEIPEEKPEDTPNENPEEKPEDTPSENPEENPEE